MKSNKFIISNEALEKNNFTMKELGCLLSIAVNGNIKDILFTLLQEGYIGQKLENMVYVDDYFITDEGLDLLEKIQNESIDNAPDDKLLEELAIQLRELFPEGKKSGTNLYWRDSLPGIIKKLKGFYKRYGVQFTPEEILEATKAYIDSFGGNYQLMRVLKYFIWKVDKSGEEISELASFIENKGQTVNSNDDWTSQLM